MKIKIAEAPKQVIDFLVAKCEGEKYGPPTFRVHQNSKGATVYLNAGMQQSGIPYRPSADWAQGGPIIERECIATYASGACSVAPKNPDCWVAEILATEEMITQYGPTPLVSAMRCYVTSKLGDEVDVPDELLCTP